jgi:hypothetical protein
MQSATTLPLVPQLFIKKKDARNTVLNWHRAPEEEFDIYAGVYWNAAQTLVKNLELDRIFGYDACPVVFLYRHSLELYLKAILHGDGKNFLRKAPNERLLKKHRLTPLVPFVRELFEKFGAQNVFGADQASTFDEFEALVNELERADKESFAFRYPVNLEGQGALSGHFTFSVSLFAEKMDEVLKTLEGACTFLPEKWQEHCEAVYYVSHPED